MKRTPFWMLTVLLAIVLAACAPSAPAAPVMPEVAETSAPAAEPTAAAAPTSAPAQPTPTTEAESAAPPAGAGSVVTYKLVPGESTLQYEVGETFLDQNNRFNLAVGVSPQVSGEITLDSTNPQGAALGSFSADVSQFTSDSGRRDNAIRGRFLESSRYPTVTFTPSAIEGLPASYQEGQDVSFTISGDLTIREVTKPATFEVTARLEGGVLSGAAVTTILMSDFGFGPISIAGILNTEDQAKVTLNFVAKP